MCCRPPVHLKNNVSREGRKADHDLHRPRGGKKNQEVILKDLLTSSTIIDEGLGKVYMFDLDTHEDKV